MKKIKNALSKMRQHISSDEFKSIESIGLLRLIPKLLKISIYLMCLLIIRWGVLESVKDLRVSATETELITTNMVISFLYGFLFICTLFMMLFSLAKGIVKGNSYQMFKDMFYVVLLYIIISLPDSFNITSQQGDFLMLASLICLVLIFLMRRVIYLKELQVLIKLGVIDKEKSSIKFYRIKELNYFVNTPDQLTKINHEWLPFVDIVLEGESRTVLNEDWKDKCTSKIYSIVVQSKFSGLIIIHTMGIHGHIERFVTMPTSVSVKESEEN